MIFHSRKDAGQQLSKQLLNLAGREDVTVLGIPRGGVTVAFEIASALHVPLDIFLSRKLGVPGHEEFAFGAVAAGDGTYLDQQVIQNAKVTPQQIERIAAKVRETLAERAGLYRGGRPPLNVRGQTVILVDDGIATGASVYAAVNALRQMKLAKIVLAIPVAPRSTCAWLRTLVDELICLYEPENFYAVGQFYEDFSQVTDDEVVALLRRVDKSSIPDSDASPSGDVGEQQSAIMQFEEMLDVPANAIGLVIFAHGSGSSRHSPRNLYVAEVLRSHGMATLLFDLLTPEEEELDRRTSSYRFDIGLLAQRLVSAVRWARQEPGTRDLPIGLFGASTGAAAALVAAARLPGLIASVVSRGGRPDLAGEYLSQVRASVLLLVGSKDEVVLGLNRNAFEKLHCEHKQLMIIPGATHLFEEAGALEKIAVAASDWFASKLAAESLKQAVPGAG
jgi:putative phosphoribosyl transferase